MALDRWLKPIREVQGTTSGTTASTSSKEPTPRTNRKLVRRKKPQGRATAGTAKRRTRKEPKIQRFRRPVSGVQQSESTELRRRALLHRSNAESAFRPPGTEA